MKPKPIFPIEIGISAGTIGHRFMPPCIPFFTDPTATPWKLPIGMPAGVDAHYAVVWGALNYVVANKKEMVRDQIEVFRRGFLDLPQQLIPDYLLAETPWDQYNEMTIQEFPAAYVIPAGPPYQLSKHQAARLVDFLLFNDVQVESAKKSFWMNGERYPKGTYVVWMNQPKRGMANTILDAGHDLSYIEGLYFYSPPSVWSHPYLWGAYRAVMDEQIPIKNQEGFAR